MGTESGADGILRDREDRRSAERQKLEGERRRRQAEIARLEAFSTGRPVADGASTDDGPVPAPSRPTPRAPVRSGLPPPAPNRAEPPRTIGGPVLSDPLQAYLGIDPGERFDLAELNRARLTSVLETVPDDPATREAVARRAVALIARAKQETDDPLSAGAFLREQVLLWYRQSATDPDWSAHANGRWAGLFADSRVSGGRLRPWLLVRLAALRDGAGSAPRLSKWIRRGPLRDRRSDRALARSPAQQIQAEVAQAMLDDLAARPREPEALHPLVRLSELAVRRQVATVNETLALLFGSPEVGPFVVLHPNRYPDCDELVVRPPLPGATGAALAYALAPGRPMRRHGVRLRLSDDGVEVAGSSPAVADPSDPDPDVDASSIWEAEAVGPGTWRRSVDERRRERRRLDAPPREFRSQPAYAPMRDLLLTDAEFRTAWLAVRWRGRPTGLPLLVSLLQKGRFAPEVATDHEYLEAELTEWAGAPADASGRWTIGDWEVRRESTAAGAVAYRAERAGPRPRE